MGRSGIMHRLQKRRGLTETHRSSVMCLDSAAVVLCAGADTGMIPAIPGMRVARIIMMMIMREK